MPDDMTREEFATALIGLESRLNERTDSLAKSMDEQFAHIDEQFARVDERFAHVDEQFARVDEQFARVDERFAHVGEQFARLSAEMDGQFRQVRIQFEHVRGDLRFGLEGRESLRETVERRFDEARERDESQHELLKHVLHHVRGRIEALEEPPDVAQG